MAPPPPEQILADPAASFWLKEALHKALTRDPVDAPNDAETLTAVLQGRLNNHAQELMA
jgi:hypothetical protein